MKPFFKWSGGKTRELSKIKPWIPKTFNEYWEPFIGGGALWLDLCPGKSHINDNYEQVANFYSVLKQDPSKLITALNNFSLSYNTSDKSTKEKAEEAADKFYYSIRNNTFTNDFDKALQFYVLRQLSFSGMLRFNSDGNFNVPFGWYKKIKLLDYDIPRLSTVLQNTDVTCQDWKSNLINVDKEDFVFLDPPYTRTFQKYHPDGNFGEIEHTELANWFKQQKAKAMIVINRDEFTTSLYDQFIKEEYQFGYSIRYRDRLSTEDNTTKHFIATNY
jgi:DNA adenine methylase